MPRICTPPFHHLSGFPRQQSIRFAFDGVRLTYDILPAGGEYEGRVLPLLYRSSFARKRKSRLDDLPDQPQSVFIEEQGESSELRATGSAPEANPGKPDVPEEPVER